MKPTALCSKERYKSTDVCPTEPGQPQEQLLNPAKHGHFFAPFSQSMIARDFPVLRYMTDFTCDCGHFGLPFQENGRVLTMDKSKTFSCDVCQHYFSNNRMDG